MTSIGRELYRQDAKRVALGLLGQRLVTSPDLFIERCRDRGLPRGRIVACARIGVDHAAESGQDLRPDVIGRSSDPDVENTVLAKKRERGMEKREGPTAMKGGMGQRGRRMP